jgi:hypothetical protein
MKTKRDVQIALGLRQITQYETRAAFLQDFKDSANTTMRWSAPLRPVRDLTLTPSELVRALGQPAKSSEGETLGEYCFLINGNFVSLYRQDQKLPTYAFWRLKIQQQFQILAQERSSALLLEDHLLESLNYNL